MRTHFGIPLAGAIGVLTVCSGLALGQDPERLELSLFQNGAVVQLEPDLRTRLARQTSVFFETCHTYASVVGEEPDESSVRQLWLEVTRGTHALLYLPAADGATDLLVGFSADSGASPVISRQSERYVLYSKCDGLGAALLACDVAEALPHSAGPSDCDRLREMERRESESTEPILDQEPG